MAFEAFLPILWIAFLIAILGSGIFGLFFSYHWSRYGANPPLAFLSVAVYAGGALVLLGLMLGAIVAL
jgi:hypothetical protein